MRLVVLVVLGAAALGCGPSPAVEDPIVLDTFETDFALAFCHRIYTCCDAIDIPTISPGGDEAACATEMTEYARGNAEFLLGQRGIIFDPKKARQCLEILRQGPCDAIFEPEYGTIAACQDLFPGTLVAGDACEASEECASRRCLSQCQSAPAPTCQDDQYVDPEANACVPRLEGGNPCMSSRQCAIGSGCVDGVCTRREPDGKACVSPQACTGTCSSSGVCRPGFCRGP